MPTAQMILERKGSDVAVVAGEATVLEAAKTMNELRIGCCGSRTRGSEITVVGPGDALANGSE